MSNLRKRMFYLGIIYILRNFNYSTRYSISAYTSNGVLLDGLIDETIISAVTYQLHLHKSIQDPEEAKALLDDQVGNIFWFYTVFLIKGLVWNLLLITCWNKINITGLHLNTSSQLKLIRHFLLEREILQIQQLRQTNKTLHLTNDYCFSPKPQHTQGRLTRPVS